VGEAVRQALHKRKAAQPVHQPPPLPGLPSAELPGKTAELVAVPCQEWDVVPVQSQTAGSGMHAQAHASSMQKLMPDTLHCEGQHAVHQTAVSLVMPEMALCNSVDKQQPTIRLKLEPSAAALEAAVVDGPGVHASKSKAVPVATATHSSPTTLSESSGANTASLTPTATLQGPLQPFSELQTGCTTPVTSPEESASQHDAEMHQDSASMQAANVSKSQAAVRPHLWQVSHSCSLIRVMPKMSCVHRSSCVCFTFCFSSNKPLHPCRSKLTHLGSEEV